MEGVLFNILEKCKPVPQSGGHGGIAGPIGLNELPNLQPVAKMNILINYVKYKKLDAYVECNILWGEPSQAAMSATPTA